MALFLEIVALENLFGEFVECQVARQGVVDVWLQILMIQDTAYLHKDGKCISGQVLLTDPSN